MRKYNELKIGMKLSHLRLLNSAYFDCGYRHRRFWLCRCDRCGGEKWIREDHLTTRAKGKRTKSCGCLGRLYRHHWLERNGE